MNDYNHLFTPDDAEEQAEIQLETVESAEDCAERFAKIDALLASIGTDEPEEVAPVRRSLLAPTEAFTTPDPNDPDVIFDPVRLTAYDRAMRLRRRLEGKRDVLLAKADLTQGEGALLTTIKAGIEKAKKAEKRAHSDIGRRHDGIDGWRATPEGKRVRNAKCRKVRDEPNADLSGLTPEQKDQHRTDQKKASQFRSEKKKLGWTPVQIEEGLKVYMAARLERRAEKAKADEEQARQEAAMRAHHPNLGMF